MSFYIKTTLKNHLIRLSIALLLAIVHFALLHDIYFYAENKMDIIGSILLFITGYRLTEYLQTKEILSLNFKLKKGVEARKYFKIYAVMLLLILLLIPIDMILKEGLNYTYIAEKNKQKIAKCDEMQKQQDKDSCYSILGGELNDTNICGKIKNQTYADLCYYIVGVQLSDVAPFVDIKDQRLRDISYMFVGRDIRDPIICTNIKDQTIQYTCYALSEGDLSPCDMLQNKTEKDWCHNTVLNKN